MNPVEQEVREMLRTKVSQAPVREEPPPVVLRRTRTLRAVNAIGATAAAAAVVIGIVFGVQGLGESRNPQPPVAPAGQVVPWLPLNSQPSDNAVLDLKPPPAEPCSSKDVAVLVVSEWGVGFVPQTPDVSCRIDPHAPGFKIVLEDVVVARGELPVTVRVADTAPVVFVDGKKSRPAGLMFTWPDYCGFRPTDAVRFDVTLPGGGMTSSSGDAGMLPPCTRPGEASTLTFEGAGTTGAAFRDDDPLVENLGTSINAPASVSRGQTLIYSVRLFNILERDVSLDRCPSYALGLQRGDFDWLLGGYRLNCEAVQGRSVPAGGSIEFEMQMTIPIELEVGEWSVFWVIDPFESTPALSVIRVI